jgi:aryl-alcohol dehydrogenase-like predicted oxidoreductase
MTGAIVGARNAKQAAGVFRAADFRLTTEEIAEIENAASSLAKFKTAP